MVRVAGINIHRYKHIVIALTSIYGIGKTNSQKILANAGVSEDTRVRDLTEDKLNKIRQATDDFTVEGDLRREHSLDIKRLTEIGSYSCMRHRRNIAIRGQKTKNNAHTRKGPRQVVSARKV